MNVHVVGADETANGLVKVSTLAVCAVAAKLYSLTLFNTGPDQYLQVFDNAAAPSAGDVPKLQIKIPADSHGSFDYGDGRIFKNGIWVGNSTTSATYTAGAADCLLDATFRRATA